ncbi:Major facilitator superfamily domain, general substrate transporter [Pseudocohnilembus persalinus]|uniref:Major facilitator superfamily domain, general substrate transporter n=1 Tax=Pseudocohnilembus persalinus TaxID=266149 RepID=A0A0V0QVR4_PSEPJ|nr:Major facilitator superfamily domain, general substrate transporter [Pseudocohnilembus persalinus]|eukprot:KRX06096.1 Major facilitator superfamily domain, general substrate transporter [Pseudocohnilembus persalinus]
MEEDIPMNIQDLIDEQYLAAGDKYQNIQNLQKNEQIQKIQQEVQNQNANQQQGYYECLTQIKDLNFNKDKQDQNQNMQILEDDQNNFYNNNDNNENNYNNENLEQQEDYGDFQKNNAQFKQTDIEQIDCDNQYFQDYQQQQYQQQQINEQNYGQYDQQVQNYYQQQQNQIYQQQKKQFPQQSVVIEASEKDEASFILGQSQMKLAASRNTNGNSYFGNFAPAQSYQGKSVQEFFDNNNLGLDSNQNSSSKFRQHFSAKKQEKQLLKNNQYENEELQMSGDKRENNFVQKFSNSKQNFNDPQNEIIKRMENISKMLSVHSHSEHKNSKCQSMVQQNELTEKQSQKQEYEQQEENQCEEKLAFSNFLQTSQNYQQNDDLQNKSQNKSQLVIRCGKDGIEEYEIEENQNQKTDILNDFQHSGRFMQQSWENNQNQQGNYEQQGLNENIQENLYENKKQQQESNNNGNNVNFQQMKESLNNSNGFIQQENQNNEYIQERTGGSLGVKRISNYVISQSQSQQMNLNQSLNQNQNQRKSYMQNSQSLKEAIRNSQNFLRKSQLDHVEAQKNMSEIEKILKRKSRSNSPISANNYNYNSNNNIQSRNSTVNFQSCQQKQMHQYSQSQSVRQSYSLRNDSGNLQNKQKFDQNGFSPKKVQLNFENFSKKKNKNRQKIREDKGVSYRYNQNNKSENNYFSNRDIYNGISSSSSEGSLERENCSNINDFYNKNNSDYQQKYNDENFNNMNMKNNGENENFQENFGKGFCWLQFNQMERQQIWSQMKKEKQKLKQEQIEQEEIQQCSFFPQTNRNNQSGISTVNSSIMEENKSTSNQQKKSLIELEYELEEILEENKMRKPLDDSIYIMSNSIIFQNPQFYCDGEQCTESKFCSYQGEQYVEGVNSLTKQFKLYCSQDYAKSIGESVPYIGSVVGLLIFMMLGDRLGRKPVYGICLIICAFGSVLIILFDNIVTIYIGMFLVGMGITPTGQLDVVILNEISTGGFRAFSMCFVYVTFAIGEMLIWPITIVVNSNWRYLYLWFLTIPFCVAIGLYFIVHETPKFLQSKSEEKTAKVLQKIAKFNGSNVQITGDMIEKSDSLQDRFFFYTDLFKYKSLRYITLSMFGLSFGCHALYYGMQVSLDLIGSNIAQNSFFVGIADFCGYLLSDIICPKMERKKNLIVTLGIASFLCISFAFDPVPEWCEKDGQSCTQKTIQIIQAMLARFVISFSFRSVGVGFIAAAGFLGAYVTPYIKSLSTGIGINFVIVCGLFGILSVLCTITQKETYKLPLKQEIDELTRRFSVQESMCTTVNKISQDNEIQYNVNEQLINKNLQQKDKK